MSWSIPDPTGPYPVACCDILDKPGIDGTFFRIYYPTKKFDAKDVQFPTWMEPEYFKELSVYMGEIKPFLIQVPLNQLLEMPAKMEKLPVLVFSHGLLLSKDAYSFVCSDLASNGFLVAAPDHKDGSAAGSFYMEKSDSSDDLVKKSFPLKHVQFGSEEAKKLRKEQVEIRVQEVSKVMDCITKLNEGTLGNLFHPNFDLSHFKGKIQLESAAVVGHSHGGTTTLVSLLKDERFKVAVTFDPWMSPYDVKYAKQRVDKSIIFINCIGDVKKEDVLRMRQLDADVTGTSAERKMVTLLGSTHFTQSDFCYFPEDFLKKFNFLAKTDAKLSNEINTKLTLSFLRKHLKLTGDQDISAIVTQYAKYAIHGSDIEVTEAEVAEAKKAVKSST